MRLSHLLATAAAALAISTASAKAADWTGFYVGVLGGLSSATIVGPDATYQLGGFGKVFGYNWDQGDTVIGVEEIVVVSNISGDPLSGEYTKVTWEKLVRFGWEIGDSALIYAAAGGGIHFLSSWYEPANGSALFGAVAAGVEYLVSEQISLRGHAQLIYSPDAIEGYDVTVASIAGGVIFHFN